MSRDYDKVIGNEGISASAGMAVVPLLKMYLHRGDFPVGKTLAMPGLGHREPDGWLHPSSHPTMPERKLFHYLAHPDKWEPEAFSYELRMSVTVGTLMHGIVETILRDLGLWEMPQGTCPACGRAYGMRKGQCHEPGVADPVLMRRGHMDGILNLPVLGRVGFDLKTINHFSVAKMPDMDVAYMRQKHPHYYGQMQEYMALSGLRLMVMVFAGMGLPWTMREVQVPYDPQFVAAMEDKYRRVRVAVASGVTPEPCCLPRSTESRTCGASLCSTKNQ